MSISRPTVYFRYLSPPFLPGVKEYWPEDKATFLKHLDNINTSAAAAIKAEYLVHGTVISNKSRKREIREALFQWVKECRG